jgi:DNA helicase-2/ATP-dependent DNA helicase PcrA
MQDWMEELNDAQRAAVTHERGPVLVIAGAGTGKTKTLAARVAWLVDRGVKPDRILLLTFTRRAAQQMLDRAGRLVGESQTTRVWGGTFHATASRLLRQHGRSIGIDPAFNVIDSEDAADLMDIVRSELGFGEGERRFPRKGTLQVIYSRVVNARKKLTDVLTQSFPHCIEDADGIRAVFEAFTKRKRAQAVLDYDDLLLYWNAMLTVPALATELSGQFDHVLVDEYQDTNPVQAEILCGMRTGNDNVMAVGDDAQSIYSFRAATVRNMLDFPQVFPGTTIVKLEQNYRSVQPILNASNRVMSRAEHQYAKNLYSMRLSRQLPRLITTQDEAGQSNAICDAILAKRETGMELKGQAVLFRTGHHSDALEVELQKRNIPFVKYGGLKFVETAHIKDLVALLRLIANPCDEMSWYRVLLMLNGVGPSSARKAIADLNAPSIGDAFREIAAIREGEAPAEPLRMRDSSDSDRASAGSAGASPSQQAPPSQRSVIRTLRHNAPKLPASAHEQFAELRDLVLYCTDAEPPPAAVVERVRAFYEPIFKETYDNPQLRIRDVEQLEQIAAGYQSLRQFVTDLTLDPPQSAQDYAEAPSIDDDYLILSTIHSAKGCEWDVVHVLHCADGNIPADMGCGSDEEIAEERRLLYVAMTRARDELNLYCPLRYYHKKHGRGDRHTYAQLTRFIQPGDFELYERVGSHKPALEIDVPAKSSGKVVANVDAMLSGLFQ